MTLKDLKHKGHRESPRRGRCHICEAMMFSPARLESLKIQLPVPGLPRIAVVCPRPRAHLSVSELSRPRQRGPAGHIGAPPSSVRQTTDSRCVFPSFLPSPEPRLPGAPSTRRCRKAWGSSECSYGRISEIPCHMHKARSSREEALSPARKREGSVICIKEF